MPEPQPVLTLRARFAAAVAGSAAVPAPVAEVFEDALLTLGAALRQTSLRPWKTAEAAARVGIDRRALDDLARRSPALVGGPVVAGEGRQRRHLRWQHDLPGLLRWVALAQAFVAEADAPSRGGEL